MPLPQPQLPHRGSRVCQLPLLPLRVHPHQQYLHFNDQQFLNFLDTNSIAEVQDDVILWDEYVEDEDGITHMNTHGIKVHDYINNYISRDVIESVVIKSLEQFVNNFQP